MKKNIIYILGLFFCITSCNTKKQIDKIVNQVEQLTSSTVNSEAVYLFNSNEKLISSWTEKGVKKEDNYLKFAYYYKETNSFSNAITVTSSKGLQVHQESMGKVAITNSGILYAVFRIKSKNSKSMYGGSLYYSISTNRGKNWSDKKKLVTDINSTSQSYFDLATLGDGELGLVWLDNRKLHPELDGQTFYFAKTKEKNGFQNEITLASSVCQCCRTDIEVDQNDVIHIGFRNIIEPIEIGYPDFLSRQKTEIRDMYYINSVNNGKSFSNATLISNDNWQVKGCPHTGPSLATTNKYTGAIWYTASNNNPGLYFTSKSKQKFKSRDLVTKVGKHPQMIAENGIFYIVYEEYYEVKGKGYSKIILEERTTSKLILKKEISAVETDNNHAVLKQINKDHILVCWVNNDTRNGTIKYVTYLITN